MSLSIKADSDIVLSKTYSMVQFKQHYTDYLKLLTEQLISRISSLLILISSISLLK